MCQTSLTVHALPHKFYQDALRQRQADDRLIASEDRGNETGSISEAKVFID